MSARTLILALAAGLTMLAAPAARAQQPPPSQVLTMSKAPDEAARKSIQAFIDANMKQIASGNPEQVQEGRKVLASLLRKPDCSLVFYRTFLQLSMPSIESILKSGDGFRATNALMVVRQVRCAEALSLMLDQSASGTQPDTRVRIAASAMVGAMVKGGAVPPTELDSVSRRARENVEAESNALSASQLVEALGIVATTAEAAKLPAQVRGALDELVKATSAAADRASKPESADFAMVVFRGLLAIRDTIVKMPSDQQAAAGKSLAPLLAKVMALPENPSGPDAAAIKTEVMAARNFAKQLSDLLNPTKAATAGK
jgi:hypothetical protein